MKQRFYCLCAILFATLLVVPTTAFAKADKQNYCENIAKDDCKIISDSEEAMQEISSAVTFTEMAIELRDIPNIPFSVAGFQYEQETTMNMSDDVVAMIADMRKMSPADVEELINDPAALIELYEEILAGTSTAIDMRLELSDEVAEIADMALRQELGVSLPETITLSIIIDDGVLYADLESISEFIPDMGSMLQGWVGAEIAPLLELAKAEVANQIPANQAELSGLNNPINMNPAGPLVAQIGTLDLSNQFIQFLNVERDEDGVIGGEDVAVFRTTFDFDTFFESPIFRQLFLQIMADQGEMDVEELTEAEIEEMITTVQMIGPIILKDLNLDVVEGVSLADSYLLSREFLMEWDMTSVLAMAEGADDGIRLPAGAEPFFSMEVNTYTEQFNEDVEIEVPEGALLLPIEAMLMGMQ